MRPDSRDCYNDMLIDGIENSGRVRWIQRSRLAPPPSSPLRNETRQHTASRGQQHPLHAAYALVDISSDRHRRPAETRIRRPGWAADTRTLHLHTPRRRDTVHAPDTVQNDTAGHLYGGLDIQLILGRCVPSVMPAAAARDQASLENFTPPPTAARIRDTEMRLLEIACWYTQTRNDKPRT
jgi:hypothetical protein